VAVAVGVLVGVVVTVAVVVVVGEVSFSSPPQAGKKVSNSRLRTARKTNNRFIN